MYRRKGDVSAKGGEWGGRVPAKRKDALLEEVSSIGSGTRIRTSVTRARTWCPAARRSRKKTYNSITKDRAMVNHSHEFRVTTVEQPSTDILAQFIQANEARDYRIYTESMDAALEAKAHALFPHFRVEEGDVIVDAGSGTGSLAELAARHFYGARVMALDLSHELQERAKEKQALIELVFGDASKKHFPDNTLAVKYYSTSGHEIESFGGEGSMRRAMEVTFRELKPGGQVIVRDFAKPSRTEPIFMKIHSSVGMNAIPENEREIDYNLLSTKQLLERFHKEFRGGGIFQYELVRIDGEEYISMDPEWAHEFYLRKDYTGNWRQEIKEKYTYWSMEQAKDLLESIGYVNVQVIPDPNEWIVEHRLRGKIELFEMNDGELKSIDFPSTHMMVIGQKPERSDGKKPTAHIVESVDYAKQISSIAIDLNHKTIQIDKKQFTVESHRPVIGVHKHIYTLASSETPRVLKIVKPDALNLHSAFRSMYQVIERQNVLQLYRTPHAKVLEHDPFGPPFRYLIQEAIPEGAMCAGDLILKGELSDEDIRQIAEIVKQYEGQKEWQLDMNPYSWFRITKEDGTTLMTYATGKVYRYDDRWEFLKVGLLQWIDPVFVKNAQEHNTPLPTKKAAQVFARHFEHSTDPEIFRWRKYFS